MKKVSYLICCIFLLNNLFLFSQEVLDKSNTFWSEVIPGKIISEPAVTSFGFSIISDARTVSTYSNSGKILWEKELKNYREAKVYALPEDFFLIVKNSFRTMTLLNPSGCEIWSKEFEYPIYGKPFYGRDGRFFIRTLSEIYCFGITGICKWKIDVPLQSSIEVQELPDGSFVTFLEKLEDGKTKGLRISPFGEILEEIIFAGKVLKSNSCNTGILLNFDDGAAGLFSLNNEKKAENKWVLQNSQLKPTYEQIQNACFTVDTHNQDSVFYVFPLKERLQLFAINTKDGSVIQSFYMDDVNGFELTKILYQNKNIFASDGKSASYYSMNGTSLWYGTLPSRSGKATFNYEIFTNDNTLIFCNTDWSLDAYKLLQNMGSASNHTKQKKYDAFFSPVSDAYLYLNQMNQDLASNKRIMELKNGNYGTKEIQFINELNEACYSYSSFLSSKSTNYSEGKSFFETDVTDLELAMCQLSLFSDSQFNSYISKFLKNVDNRNLIFALLSGIAENGYDPELKIMNGLSILAGKTKYKDDAMLCKICDSVYSICLFMGRPAYNSKGKDIIKQMLGANYSSKTRVYARNTLKKIMDLEL